MERRNNPRPCPFCGSPRTGMNFSYGEGVKVFASCTECRAHGPEDDSASRAIRMWNKAGGWE